MSVPEQPQEHGLEHVFGVGGVAGDSISRPKNSVMMGLENALDAFRLVSHGDSLYCRLYCRHLHVQDSVCKEMTAERTES